MEKLCLNCEKKLYRYNTSGKCKLCWCKTRIFTLEDRKKISERYKGEKNPDWKGNRVGYRGIHMWIQKQLGKATRCSINSKHISIRYHWANISKKYKRNFSDWMQMCPSCNSKDRIGRRVSA